MKDAISILHTLNSINFIKNIKEKINNKENAVTNKDYLSIIENSNVNDDIMDILDEIVVALLNVIWTNEQEKSRNYTLKKFIKHVLKYSNATTSIYICAIYYLLNLKDNSRYNNLLKKIHLEIENIKQEQGFINNCNIHERCCPTCGAYISCYKSETIVCKCRLFLTSLILASKFGQDKNYSNRAWSKISRFPVENINYNERFFLNLIDYKLFINLESYHKLATVLSGQIVNVEEQKKKLKNQQLLNLSKINTANVNTIQEWKKNMENKALLRNKLRQIRQMEAIKAKLKIQSLQTKNNGTSIYDKVTSNIQKLSPCDSNVSNDSSYELENTKINVHSGVFIKNEIINQQNESHKPTDISEISPISPSYLPTININANNIANVNNTPNSQQMPLLPSVSANQEKKNQDKLTIESFSSFVKFYSCINEKFSTSSESVIKSTDSYKILEFALSLVCKRRVQDAINILNSLIYGTVDICKEILSLALKGQIKTALIYIYLLTPNEINFYNTHIKNPNIKSLTHNDVLSIVSKLINCVQKSTKNTETKKDLLGNLSSQQQVNISSNQNVLLKFIQNINCSLSHN